ncbi:class I SAM-dependent methyltransferase [Methylobacterium sp. NEAU K]|uniref:class I SAM-dependent methyltransferase n=1 Tax=Methylobacterium sp. NEAU K TaxID=3064946 RepID=UPI0027341E63|nr:methyltransferase [Methylobacterium sp. NEAU K]MDP4006864.1 methyltransferase [Methylobacterium sp. NEAU K]
MRQAVYGLPPVDLAEVAGDAVQVSPLIPGSARLEDLSEGSLDVATVLAPPGTVERRYVLAQILRALVPGGRMVALAPKDRGGTRLAKELAAFDCPASDQPRRHHRICTLVRPPAPAGIAAAIEAGGPRHVDNLALCTQPGIFSWDRLDPGTALLLANLPPLKGRGADLGAGLGILSRAVLGSSAVTALTLVEIDRRAVEMAGRNIADPRAAILWADVRTPGTVPGSLDFVVMNPPFHDGGTEDQALGRTFIARAAEALRAGGMLWLVANAHLPYEGALREAFRSVSVTVQAGGYRVYEARR